MILPDGGSPKILKYQDLDGIGFIFCDKGKKMNVGSIYEVFGVYGYYVIKKKKEMMKYQDLVNIFFMFYYERKKNE